jgi:hypothetical protein
MADIVLGIATSHGPMLVTAPEQWEAGVAADRGASHYFRGRPMRPRTRNPVSTRPIARPTRVRPG